ncbi:MAG TPA: alpha/beta fold hydrolase [Candidatus Thermoplasmatota archaeon]|nr:alpha/beta fold hydrolase [Candidatus Thermoplasmatota archaeon]
MTPPLAFADLAPFLPPAPPGRIERHVAGALVRATLFRRRKAGAWPVPADLPHEDLAFRGNTGARIAGRHFPVAGARGIVVLAHPDRRYGQFWFVREGWVQWLRGHGYACLTFDFSQYGASRGGSTYLFEDLAAAARLARDLHPGLPVHVIGLSIGAFSAANASPDLDFVEALVLESPYPSFGSWYEGDGHRFGKAVMRGFDRLFPRTARLIQADQRIARAGARRILVAASRDDEVTPVRLSRRVADRAPTGRSEYLELEGHPHLGLFRDIRYREAVLRTLAGAPSP